MLILEYHDRGSYVLHMVVVTVADRQFKICMLCVMSSIVHATHVLLLRCSSSRAGITLRANST